MTATPWPLTHLKGTERQIWVALGDVPFADEIQAIAGVPARRIHREHFDWR